MDLDSIKSDPFFAPRDILQFFGFWRQTSPKYPKLNVIRSCIVVVYLACAWFLTCASCANIVGAFVNPKAKTPFLSAVHEAPIFFDMFRGVMTLTIFFFLSSKITEEVDLILVHAKNSFNVHGSRRYMIKAISAVTFLLAFRKFLVWGISGYCTPALREFTPFRVLVPGWVIVATWTFFTTLPFWFSQLLLVAFMFTAKLFDDCLGGLVCELETLSLLRRDYSDSEKIIGQLNEIQSKYFQIVVMAKRYNDISSSAIAGGCILNILVLMALIVSWIGDEKAGTWENVAYSSQIFAYLMYSTGFYFPMVYAYERSTDVTYAVQSFELTGRIASGVPSQASDALDRAVEKLLILTKDCPILFHGLGIFFLTRAHLVMVITTIISVALIAPEMLDRGTALTGNHFLNKSTASATITHSHA